MGTMAAALVRLLGAQGQEIEDRVQGVHAAVAARVFTALGPMGRPSGLVHDVVADGVHRVVRGAVGGAGRLGGLLAEGVPDEVLLGSVRGRAVVGAVLGLIGDHVRDVEPDLAWPFVLLRDGVDVASEHDEVPTPTDATELVVLLHGLCETEDAWSLGSGGDRRPLPEVLAAPGREVLVGRMNSGLRPAELGRVLAGLLRGRSGRARVVLVGHSMGGLVARAALREGAAAGHDWVDRCDTVVTLGTPHLGAPLEKAVDVLVRVGGLAPEVDAITQWFDQRSAGIRDLRHGVDDETDAPGVRVRAAPLPRHVTLHTVGARLPGGIGELVGDGLVRRGSAHARGVRGTVSARRGEPLDIDGSHFDLLCDPRVTSHVASLVADAPGAT